MSVFHGAGGGEVGVSSDFQDHAGPGGLQGNNTGAALAQAPLRFQGKGFLPWAM